MTPQRKLPLVSSSLNDTTSPSNHLFGNSPRTLVEEMQALGFVISSERQVIATTAWLENLMRELQSFAAYDLVNGGFIRTCLRSGKGAIKKVGEPAGTKNWRRGGKPMCSTIQVGKRTRKEHWLVWVWFTGRDIPPGMEIDHINVNPFDNKVENLRAVFPIQNHHNGPLRRNNSTGVTNIQFHQASQKYMVQMMFNRQHYYGGLFDTIEEAIIARDALKARLNSLGASFTESHGERR